MPTGMHGFRLTDYIDAIAVADFIDQEDTEYIATDRRSHRWDTFFLQGLREFLSNQMKEAVVAYQRLRDQTAVNSVREDPFAQETINRARLPRRRLKTAQKLAGTLASMFPEGVEDSEYQRNLEILVGGLGQGTVLEDLAAITSKDLPGFNFLSKFDLAIRETGELSRFAEGRIDAIEALKKIVEDVDFRQQKRESELQQLFERAPWLINPVFTQLVTANQWVNTTYQRLAKHLKIREFAADPDRDRADLVFLVGTSAGNELTIVELKAANKPLILDDLLELKDYRRKAVGFLRQHVQSHVEVRVLLIGSRNSGSKSEGVQKLDWEIEDSRESAIWKVRDLTEVLGLAEHAHNELIAIYRQVVMANLE